MNRYRMTVSVKKTYIAEETVTFEVEAETEQEAIKKAEDIADDKSRISSFDADLDETETDVHAVEFIEGMDDTEGRIPRCDKTPDMFGEQA